MDQEQERAAPIDDELDLLGRGLDVAVGAITGAVVTLVAAFLGAVAALVGSLGLLFIELVVRRSPTELNAPVRAALFAVTTLGAAAAIGRSAVARDGASSGAAIGAFALVAAGGVASSPVPGPLGADGWWAAGLGAATLAGAVVWGQEATWSAP